MMNKRALIMSLVIVVVIVIGVVVAIVYYTGNFKFNTGKVSVDINYDNSKNVAGDGGVEVVEQPPVKENPAEKNSTNKTRKSDLLLNTTEQNLTINYTEVSNDG